MGPFISKLAGAPKQKQIPEPEDIPPKLAVTGIDQSSSCTTESADTTAMDSIAAGVGGDGKRIQTDTEAPVPGTQAKGKGKENRRRMRSKPTESTTQLRGDGKEEPMRIKITEEVEGKNENPKLAKIMPASPEASAAASDVESFLVKREVESLNLTVSAAAKTSEMAAHQERTVNELAIEYQRMNAIAAQQLQTVKKEIGVGFGLLNDLEKAGNAARALTIETQGEKPLTTVEIDGILARLAEESKDAMERQAAKGSEDGGKGN